MALASKQSAVQSGKHALTLKLALSILLLAGTSVTIAPAQAQSVKSLSGDESNRRRQNVIDEGARHWMNLMYQYGLVGMPADMDDPFANWGGEDDPFALNGADPGAAANGDDAFSKFLNSLMGGGIWFRATTISGLAGSSRSQFLGTGHEIGARGERKTRAPGNGSPHIMG